MRTLSKVFIVLGIISIIIAIGCGFTFAKPEYSDANTSLFHFVLILFAGAFTSAFCFAMSYIMKAAENFDDYLISQASLEPRQPQQNNEAVYFEDIPLRDTEEENE
ncbi:MAG: hypothetical protein IJJ99_04085 [Oscillospiraceae bacterium]|nr:hypothetical protein [Oscillospiraceae bacterium]